MSSSIRRFTALGLRSYRFLSLDMWRLRPEDLSSTRRYGVATLRVLYMTILSYIEQGIGTLAGSLTYSTALSVVPLLAVIIGVAKGFGLQEIVRDALIQGLPGHEVELAKAFTYVENYLAQVQGGLFIGVGLALLFYTVLMLISTIEDSFNRLWQAPSARPWGRRIMGYLSAFLLLPLLMTISSATTIFLSTLNHTYLSQLGLISTVTNQLLQLLPFAILIILFTLLYLLIPNVRVHFVPALIAGVIAGLAFQCFQALYINGVLWISKYNAIYGSFAAVPLALLWTQLSWVIILLGAQISYAVQHVWYFTTPPLSGRLSRRYEDLILISVAATTARLFAEGHRPLPEATTLAERSRLPLRETQEALLRLLRLGVLAEVRTLQHGAEQVGYQPALPLDRLTLGYLMELVDREGEEVLPLELDGRHESVWQLRRQLYRPLFRSAAQLRICDIDLDT